MPKIYAKEQYLIIGDDYFIPDYRIIESVQNSTLRLESTSNQPTFKFPLSELTNESGSTFASIPLALDYLRKIVYVPYVDYLTAVSAGNIEGTSIWNKFGYNEDVDTANSEIIASWGGALDPTTDFITTDQTFTITYNSATDGSGTTGATQLFFTYLDENNLLAQGFHVLGATGTDVTSFTGYGINRVVVLANGGAGYNTNDITITATTDGTTQAQIPALGSVTEQCIFFTPINTVFTVKFLFFNCLKLSGGGVPRVNFKGYSWSRVTNTRYEIFNSNIDTNVENSLVLEPPIPFVVTGREVLYFEASTSTNNTSVNCRFSGILSAI